MSEQKATKRKPIVRCAECDREVSHYITFTSPTNEERDVCAMCLEREEKHFNTSREWKRVRREQ